MKRLLSISIAFLIIALLLDACKKDVNPALGVENSFAAIYAVKNIYKGNDVKLNTEMLAGAGFTGGVVISDASGKNLAPNTFVIQNNNRGLTSGLVVDLGETIAPFLIGDSLVLDLSNATLSKDGNGVRLKGLSLNAIQKISAGNKINPRSVAIGELNSNFKSYENTLVKITADTRPTPASGETFAGNKVLDDGSGSTIVMHTDAAATFSAQSLPASATYTAIAFFGNESGGSGDLMQLRVRMDTDIENASGPIYANWPESFESPAASFKGSYSMNTAAVPNDNVELKTGNWKLTQSIIGNLNANRDRFNAPGLQCIRMQQGLSVPGYIQMNFDLPNGASKITFWQGAYSTDVSSTFRLEYSTDSGLSWIAATPDIKTMTGGSKQETVLLNIKGKVRFRIMKLGLGANSVPIVLNGRLCIEDIAVYSN